MIDFHAHILPKMDDGSSSVNESMQMLKLSRSMGIDTIVSTSHYYKESQSINTFLQKRNEKYNQLVTHVKGVDKLPKIILGAEVAFFTGMSREKDISKLCIENTKFLLLEMPFSCWTSLTIKEVQALITNRGITPIIAHIERYFPYQKKTNRINELLDLGVLVQANAESIIEKENRRKLLKMISNGSIHLLGSDCHNIIHRPPNLENAYKIIEKKLGRRYLQEIDINGRSCLQPNINSNISPLSTI